MSDASNAPDDGKGAEEKESGKSVEDDVLKDTLSQLARFERLYEKVNKCNEELRLENEGLKAQLHEYRASKKNRVEAASQTCEELCDYSKYPGYTNWYQYHDGYQNSSVTDPAIESTDTKKAGDIGEDGMPVWSSTTDDGNEGESLAEGLKAAVTEVLQESGVVYDENSGLYYDYDSGYYFNAERSLYYEPHSGTYYTYDSKTHRYEVHSRVEPTKPPADQQTGENKGDQQEDKKLEKSKRSKKRKKKKRKHERNPPDETDKSSKEMKHIEDVQHPEQSEESTKTQETTSESADNMKSISKTDSSAEAENATETLKSGSIVDSKSADINADSSNMSGVESNSEEEMEEGEVSDTDTSDSDSDTEPEEETISPPVEEVEEGSHFAPCIRAMVTASDALDVGSLFIITCQGGTIGREQGLNHTVVIPDLNVSKMHASIEYKEDLKKYVVRDHASQNGTFVNNHRLSKPKEMSLPFPLGHMNDLKLGDTNFEIHIHPGTETCDNCEPGQVRAAIQEKNKVGTPVLSKAEKDKLRRKELKQIKRRFGLENMKFIDDAKEIKKSGYADKSAERRRTKGSDNPYQLDDAPASSERAIPESNKGHRMLAKMGWKEGHGLGAKEQGRSEPVSIRIRSKVSAGLGSQANQVSLDDYNKAASNQKWLKAQERFENLFTPSQWATMSSPEVEQKKKKTLWVPGGIEKPP